MEERRLHVVVCLSVSEDLQKILLVALEDLHRLHDYLWIHAVQVVIANRVLELLKLLEEEYLLTLLIDLIAFVRILLRAQRCRHLLALHDLTLGLPKVHALASLWPTVRAFLSPEALVWLLVLIFLTLDKA